MVGELVQRRVHQGEGFRGVVLDVDEVQPELVLSRAQQVLFLNLRVWLVQQGLK